MRRPKSVRTSGSPEASIGRWQKSLEYFCARGMRGYAERARRTLAELKAESPAAAAPREG